MVTRIKQPFVLWKVLTETAKFGPVKNYQLYDIMMCSTICICKYLPARASEQGNVIGSVSVYIYIYIYMSSKKNCN